MAISTTLSTSAIGTAAIVLNPVSKSTTVTLNSTTAAGTGSSASLIQVDYSLDDPTIPGGPTTSWSLLSSAAAMQSSAVLTLGLSWTVLSPIGQVRVNNTVASTGAAILWTLKALQSVTA